MDEITINRNDKIYVLPPDISDRSPEITGDEAIRKNYDFFWIYTLAGLHDGEPIKIGVKNPHYEPDGDEHGVYYCFTDEGWFWADDFEEEIPDDLREHYECLCDAVKEDYNISAD